MNERVARLRAQVGADRTSLERRLADAESLDLGAPGATYHFAWVMHHAYCALEAILERTARVLEGGLPDGADWHKELLDGAFLDVPELRPAILSRRDAAGLHDLRGFGHFVRHAYDADLERPQLETMQARVRALRPGLIGDLVRFETFLKDLGAVDGDPRR